MAQFMAMAAVFTYVKPVAGIWIDTIPLFGTRRRHYALAGAVVGAVAWLAVGLVPVAFTPLLLALVLANTAVMLSNTVVGTLVVEWGQASGTVGRLTSLRLAGIQMARLVVGPLGAWLATRDLAWTAAVCAATNLLFLASTAVVLVEPPSPPGPSRWTAIKDELRLLVRDRTLWLVVAFVFLDELSPGFGTPFFYRMTDELHLPKSSIGAWSAVVAVAGMSASALYAVVHRKIALRRLLVFGVFIHAAGAPIVLALSTPASVLPVGAIYGLTQTLAALPLFDLAARASPRAGAALAYALVMSAINLAFAGSDILGVWLQEQLSLSFAGLVAINATSTLVVLPLIAILPAALVDSR
jgi:hypothetical protein